jgi:hypothetical protein
MGKIDLMQTEMGDRLRKAKMLSDAVAWYEAMNVKTCKQIIEWVQKDQLMDKGIDGTGGPITDRDGNQFYSIWTEILSGGKKKAGDPYNLNDTGAFYRGMFVNVLRDSFVVDSDEAIKEDGTDLFYEYGDDIVGLTDENMEKLKAVLKEEYQKYAKRVLGLD